MQTTYTPAQYVIHLFGGVRATAREMGKTPGAIGFWRHRGLPSSIHKKILAIAKIRGLDLTPNDLIFGRKIIVEK